MNKFIIAVLKMVGCLAVFTYIMFSPVTTLANEDNDFSRPIYSLQEINSGLLGDTITFNSIVSDPADAPKGTIANETNFVGARIDDGNHGVDNVWKGSEIIAEDGQTYIIRLYVHNNNPGGYGTVAEGVQVRFYIPPDPDTSLNVHGYLKATNATPNEYVDNVLFTSADGTPFHLEYVYNSALLENGGFASGAGVTLSDNVVNLSNSTGNSDDNWTPIGYDALDGKIPGCYEYTEFVTIKVKVVYDYEFSIETKVRLVDDDEEKWQDTIEAKVGDEVEFRIEYVNISGQTHNHVAVRDIMPENLEYVTGSTRLFAASDDFISGPYLSTNSLVADNGIDIGSYESDSNAIVRFMAKVVDNNLFEGSNTLVNWGQARVGMTILQDYACVVVYQDTEFQKVSTILLVLIIILLIAIAILLYIMFRKRPHR